MIQNLKVHLQKSRMEIFQLLRKNMTIIGADPPKSGQKFSFRLRTFVSITFLGKSIVLLVVGLLYEASAFDEYAESIQTIITVVAILFAFYAIIIKIEKISELINNFEIMIEKRKFRDRIQFKI